jgi:PAS domain S-box-containing protein
MREELFGSVNPAEQEKSASIADQMGMRCHPSCSNSSLSCPLTRFLLRIVRGKIRGLNVRAEQLFGFSRAELLDRSIDSLIPDRFRENHPAHVRKYNSQPRTRFMGVGLELFGLHKDGTEVPVDIMLKPVETAEGMLVLSFVRDISEQRRAKVALLRSEHQLRSMVENIKEYAMFLLDIEGRISSWNPGAERIKGYKADEILGRHFS